MTESHEKHLEETARFLSGVSLFAGLAPAACGETAKSVEPQTFPEGDTIIFGGEDCDDLYFLCGGSATVELGSGADTKVLATFKPGDFFGEMAMFDRQPRSATVRAGSTCQVLKLPREAFARIAKDNPSILWNLCVEFSHRLRATTVMVGGGD
jgi:CRP-like cAMP-binding protein